MGSNNIAVFSDTVCVVIPVFNAEKTIRRTLSSVLKQTHKDIVVVVVDDGSTDSSKRIVSSMAHNDSRIVVISQDNSGSIIARRRGSSFAKENKIPFLCFCDADDILPRNSIMHLIKAIKETGADLVCGKHILRWQHIPISSSKFSDDPKNHLVLYTSQEIREKLVVSFFGINVFPVSFWGKIFRTELVSKALNEPPVVSFYGDDVSVVLKVVLNCEKICTISSVVYYYQRGTGSGKIKNCMLDDYKKLYRFRKTIIDDYCLDEKCAAWLDIEMMSILQSYLLSVCDNTGQRKEISNSFLKTVETISQDGDFREAAAGIIHRKMSNRLAPLIHSESYVEIAKYIEDQKKAEWLKTVILHNLRKLS